MRGVRGTLLNNTRASGHAEPVRIAVKHPGSRLEHSKPSVQEHVDPCAPKWIYQLEIIAEHVAPSSGGGRHLGGYNLMQLICKIVTLPLPLHQPSYLSTKRQQLRDGKTTCTACAEWCICHPLAALFLVSFHIFHFPFPGPLSLSSAERIKSKGKVR